MTRFAAPRARARARALASPPHAEPAPLPGSPAGAVPGALARALLSAGLAWDAGRVAVGWVAVLVVVTGAAAAVVGPGLGALATAMLIATPVALLASGQGRLERQLERALPGVLEQVAGSLRSGASLRQALAEARPAGGDAGARALRDDLTGLAAEVGSGCPLAEALEHWQERRAVASARMTVAVLVLGAVSGGPQARAIDGLATTLRERSRLEGEVGVLAAQAKASAVVIAVAPLAFALLAAATDPTAADFLVRSPAGLACLGGGLALDGMAAAWMAHIVRAAR